MDKAGRVNIRSVGMLTNWRYKFFDLMDFGRLSLPFSVISRLEMRQVCVLGQLASYWPHFFGQPSEVIIVEV